MKDLHIQLTHATAHAAQTSEWLQAAHSACNLPASGALASFAIFPLLKESAKLQRKIAALTDAISYDSGPRRSS